MSPKVFLLDPAKNTISLDDQLPKFLQLGAKEGWQISRPVRFEPDMDGTQWISNLRNKAAHTASTPPIPNLFSIAPYIGRIIRLPIRVSDKWDCAYARRPSN